MALALTACGGQDALTPETPSTAAADHDPMTGGAQATAPTSGRPMGLWAGERMVVDVRSRGITIGEARFGVGAPCAFEGRPVLPVWSDARRVGLYGLFSKGHGRVASWLDAESGAPVRTLTLIANPKRTRLTDATYTGDGYRYDHLSVNHRIGKKRRYQHDRNKPPYQPLYDVHALIGTVRQLAAERGTRVTLNVVSGRALYQLDVRVAAEVERLTIRDVDYDTVRVDGVLRRMTSKLRIIGRPKSLSLWVTDEPARLPVRATMDTRKGPVEATLASYERVPLSLDGRLQPCAAPDQSWSQSRVDM